MGFGAFRSLRSLQVARPRLPKFSPLLIVAARSTFVGAPFKSRILQGKGMEREMGFEPTTFTLAT